MWQPSSPAARHETQGAVAVNTSGLTVTFGTSNAKGSWADIGTPTTFAYEAITLFDWNGGGASDVMLDIGISDGTNRLVLCADLHLATAKLTVEQGLQLYIPVHVPAGSQLSIRGASSAAGAVTHDLVLLGHSAGLGGAAGFSRCVALFTPASSRGIAIDPGGTANTKGSWAQITASCPNDIAAMFGLIGYNGDVARVAQATTLIDIGIGAGGSEFVLYPNAFCGWSTVRDGPSNCPRIPLFACDVPSGTRIASRSACSLNTAGDRTIDLALYGLVK